MEKGEWIKYVASGELLETVIASGELIRKIRHTQLIL